MDNKFKASNSKAVTLLELIIVMAVILLISALAFSIHFFGLDTFAIGKKQSNIQYEVRMAALHITREVRNAETVEILDCVPETFNPGKKYIYAGDNAVKCFKGGMIKNLSGEINGGVNLEFKPNNSSGKILNFRIHADPGDKNYSIDSEVLILNIGDNSIEGSSSGSVVSFGPLTDAESVSVDAMNLDLASLNGDLSSVTSNLILPSSGANGTTITWVSENPAVDDNGIVTRPGVDMGDATGALTATISKDTEVETKTFIVTVKDLDTLVLEDISPEEGFVGQQYTHKFTANGGDGLYLFTHTAGNLPDGLNLSAEGELSGIPATAGTYIFTVTVTDGSGNSASTEFTVVIS